ncbi:MAG: hypothetical protein IPL56_19780 [Saprospiraceae bacterium]|nr:hypothetical protein [Saprospiraceae bacterium]MBK6477469.1 hypothetical protein [Saprospiraceae bacterium]MBK7436316.1 hypothetical protein [Saprospiraceae bacterium]MBK7609194.1 hypothetical protein [Saprospiraceae bacterium]MBK8514444.1 hypothetical protein [Saprospiraceae bacterium]
MATKKLIAKAIIVAPATPKFQYAAKFICKSSVPGTSLEDRAFLPGNYQTLINIHNPWTKPVKFRVKIAWPIEISKYLPFELKPDGVLTLSCQQIDQFGLHLIHGFEGFMVIESAASLDVTAVYMAGEKAVSSIDVEDIRERKLR